LAVVVTSLMVGAWVDPSMSGTEIVHQLSSRVTCASYVFTPQLLLPHWHPSNADNADQCR
jgi:hypothetical protein